MIKTILSVIRRSLFLLLKNPQYLLLGMIFAIGNWFPIPIRWENQTDLSLVEIPLVKKFLSHFTSPENALFFIIFIILFFWIAKIILLSLLYLGVYSSQKNKERTSLLKMMGIALSTLPPITSLHILLTLSLFALFLFLGLPTASLFSTGSFYAAGFLGFLAIIIFFSASIAAFAIFLFSHFFILFSQLPLKGSLDVSARLYQKKRKITILFLLFFLVVFIFLQILTTFLPGFYLSGNSLVPSYTQLPIIINIIGFLTSFFLLAIYFTVFPIASVLFFLHIAKQPPQKKTALKEIEPAITPILKNESGTFQEVKKG